MKEPEEYFIIRKEGNCTIYEWREKSRMLVAGLLGIALVVTSFVKTFIDQAQSIYVFIITAGLVITVIIFFWVYDQFRLAFDKEGLFVARGVSVFFGSGLGRHYLKKDIRTLYTKFPLDHTNFDFTSDAKIICMQLNDGSKIRLTNALSDEHFDFIIAELKVFFIFSDSPAPVDLKGGLKYLIAWIAIVVTGAATPRLMEVGEYALEKQSNSMRVALGLMGMGFAFWIFTSTDALSKKGELSLSQKLLIFIMSIIPTAAILAYLYLM